MYDHIQNHKNEIQKSIQNSYNSLEKSGNNDLQKAGEGSRGGKVIGHDKQGKPIYANTRITGRFSHQGQEHHIKKVESGIIHTHDGKMFKQATLEEHGVEFSREDIPKKIQRPTAEQRYKLKEEVRDAEDDYDTAQQELDDLYQELEDLDSDMNEEAGQKGDDWSDADANRYGGEMNEIEEKIEKQKEVVESLKKKWEELEEKYDNLPIYDRGEKPFKW